MSAVCRRRGLISAARAARAVRYADEFGVDVPDGSTVDFARVMERMRRFAVHHQPQ